jgi:hypothetical protein
MAFLAFRRYKNLRKILGDRQSGTRYVSNVPGRGYCFVAPTTRINARDSSGDQPAVRRYALPRFGTQVIGRESVIDALVPQLAQRGPLTIVGPGGIGNRPWRWRWLMPEKPIINTASASLTSRP